MATDQVNGNGSVSEEPMDTTEVTRSEHFPALLEAGLPQNVAEKLDELYVAAADLKRYIVRAGDEVTLSFVNVIHDQDVCESTLWRFYGSRGPSVKLFEDGQIHKAKSDRLRVTENCSLGIKKVTEEDAGVYTCRQFSRSGKQQSPESEVLLNVVTMTEHQVNDEVTLNCSVSTFRDCEHSVKWLLQGRDVDKDHREINTSHPQSSGDATTTGTPAIDEWTSENNKGTGADCKHPEGPAVWWLILVSVGLAALIVTVVTVHIWTRAKGEGS
ncbi:hypothetical protein JOQ06_027789 [Pogonophryne albipinna]|uniref:Immunoglobulin domain-containing protein n=1 Tax=Pogonophryne albipinna TaxID=1090488 RepID=A0AAD6F604_9TELE|nr:hypothetical protein JOQ06_027789 [Pogonophryne albipinna]